MYQHQSYLQSPSFLQNDERAHYSLNRNNFLTVGKVAIEIKLALVRFNAAKLQFNIFPTFACSAVSKVFSLNFFC